MGYTGTRAPGPHWSVREVSPHPQLCRCLLSSSLRACLASALPTKPGPPRQAASVINFDSNFSFFFLLFSNVQGHECEAKLPLHCDTHMAKRGELFSMSSFWGHCSHGSRLGLPLLYTCRCWHTHRGSIRYSLPLWILF